MLYTFGPDLSPGVVPETGSVQGVASHGVGPGELLTLIQHFQTTQEHPAVDGPHWHLHLTQKNKQNIAHAGIYTWTMTA